MRVIGKKRDPSVVLNGVKGSARTHEAVEFKGLEAWSN